MDPQLIKQTDHRQHLQPTTGDQEIGSKRLMWEYLLVLGLVGTLYVISVAPGVLWQDSGMAQIRVIEGDYVGGLGLALAHPLYYLMARIFQHLPFAESAFKTNLVSAVFASLTVANVYLLFRLILGFGRRRWLAAIVGTIGIALAHTFWQHAALAEVYTLSTFFLTLQFILLVRFIQTTQPGWWLAAWFFNGVECSNHMLAVVTLAPVAIWSVYYFRTQRIRLTWFAPAILLWIAGCSFYLYFGFQEWRAGESIGEVIHSMLFGRYQEQVLNVRLTAGLIVTSLGVIVLNFPTPNLLLIPLGLAKATKVINRPLFILLISITAFHLAFAVRYDVRDQYTFFIIPVLLLAIWLGVGAAWLMDRISQPKAWALVVLGLIPPIFYALIPPMIARHNPDFSSPPIPYRDEAGYFFLPWKTGYRQPELLARDVFDLAGPDAIVIADSTSIRPFLYYQRTENLRPDVEMTFALFPDLSIDEQIARLTEEIKVRQVLLVRPYPSYAPQWILDHFHIVPNGPVFQVDEPR